MVQYCRYFTIPLNAFDIFGTWYLGILESILDILLERYQGCVDYNTIYILVDSGSPCCVKFMHFGQVIISLGCKCCVATRTEKVSPLKQS